MLDQREPAWRTLRIIAEEDADGVFLLSDSPFQIWNLGIRGIEDLLSLEHIEFCSHAVIKPKVGEPDRIGLCNDRVTRDLEFQGGVMLLSGSLFFLLVDCHLAGLTEWQLLSPFMSLVPGLGVPVTPCPPPQALAVHL